MFRFLLAAGMALAGLCLSAQQTLFGTYSITQRTMIQKSMGPLSRYTSRIIGSELSLNRDSSFCYLTCGNMMKGSWSTDGDSVYLTIRHNEYRTDSMKATGEKPLIPVRPLAFKVKAKGRGGILLYRGIDEAIELLKKSR